MKTEKAPGPEDFSVLQRRNEIHSKMKSSHSFGDSRMRTSYCQQEEQDKLNGGEKC